MKELKGRNCIITGAANGIGRSFAFALAKEGMNLYLTDIDLKNLNNVEKDIMRNGTKVYSMKCDVTQLEDWKLISEDFYSKFENLDLLINNAGIAIGGNILAITLDDWKKVLNVNLWGIIRSLDVFLPKLIEQDSGHIVNMASGAGIFGATEPLPYITSKFAVVGLSEALFGQLGVYNIKVSVIIPSYIKTGIYQKTKVRYPPKLIEDFGIEKLEEISKSILDEMQKNAMDVSRAVKKYIRGIKKEQLYIYDSKAVLRTMTLKGSDPIQFQNFLRNYCKEAEKQTKNHFSKYGIDIEKYYK